MYEDCSRPAPVRPGTRAHFPAGSTLKLGIAVETLRSLRGKPARGSYVDRLLRRAIQSSDNIAANELEVLIGGSTSGGDHRVTALMHDLGLVDSEMYGGYIPGTLARRLPIHCADEQPYYGVGKRTSAYDMAQLFAYIHLAAGGKGRLAKRLARLHANGRALSPLPARTSPTGASSTASSAAAHRPCTKPAGSPPTSRRSIVYWAGGAHLPWPS